MPKPFSLVFLVLSPFPVLTPAFDHDGTAEAKVGWISEDNKWSALNVIWSSLGVILVCTYKATHLSIPAEEPSWLRWQRRSKWMGWMALSPELLFS